MVNVTQEELYNELVYQIYIELGKGHHQYDS